MKAVLVLFAAWGLAGFGAVVGSIVGNAAGKVGLFAGAVVGGMVGVWVAVTAVIRFRWIAAENRRGALVGGMLGFAIAAPIAATNLHTPVIPVLICGLSGVGVLLGVRMARVK